MHQLAAVRTVGGFDNRRDRPSGGDVVTSCAGRRRGGLKAFGEQAKAGLGQCVATAHSPAPSLAGCCGAGARLAAATDQDQSTQYERHQ